MQALRKNKSTPSDATEAADRLHSAAIHLLRSLRIRDRETGIGPAQLSALSVLVFAGAKSLAQLAEAEQVKPPTMSRIVAGLLRAKLVRRETDPQDRRALVIQATEKGVRLMQEARRRRVESLAATLRKLPQAEVTRLRLAAEAIELLSRRI
jgi:DNA-binding MarR family transcriptional regulator